MQIADELSFRFLASNGLDITDTEEKKLSDHLFVLLSHTEGLKKTVKANQILSEILYTHC